MRIVAFVALALAVATAAWFLTNLLRSGDTEISVEPVAPVGLSAKGLRQLAASVGQPIYWVGPKTGYQYELSRNSKGAVFIRYLPPGVQVGAPGAKYLLVATYPYVDAYQALDNLTGGPKFGLPRGGIAVVDEHKPGSVHVAYPGENYQVEVYDPSPERALDVARSAELRQVG